MSQTQQQCSMDINGVVHADAAPDRPPSSDDPAGDYQRSTLLVVLTLIATLSFQLGVNPPGGFWQDDASGHVAGNAIMKDKNPKRYRAFSIFTWLCFWESMVLILALMNGVPLKSRWIRGLFIFCYSSLAFLFLASQTDVHLPWAFAVWLGVMLWAAWVMWKN